MPSVVVSLAPPAAFCGQTQRCTLAHTHKRTHYSPGGDNIVEHTHTGGYTQESRNVGRRGVEEVLCLNSCFCLSGEEGEERSVLQEQSTSLGLGMFALLVQRCTELLRDTPAGTDAESSKYRPHVLELGLYTRIYFRYADIGVY